MGECDDCDKKCESHETFAITVAGIKSKLGVASTIIIALLLGLISFTGYTFGKFSTYKEVSMNRMAKMEADIVGIGGQINLLTVKIEHNTILLKDAIRMQEGRSK